MREQVIPELGDDQQILKMPIFKKIMQSTLHENLHFRQTFSKEVPELKPTDMNVILCKSRRNHLTAESTVSL